MKKYLLPLLIILLVPTLAFSWIGGGPFGPVPPSDLAYNAATWNGSYLAPTQNAVRDQLEVMIAAAAIGGADTQVQYNDGGAFGGDAGLTYDDVLDALIVVGPIAGATLNTGQGANELYAMDQDVQQADTPTFAGLDAGGQLVTNVLDAVNPTDAANLQTVLEHTGVTLHYYFGNTTLDQTLTESEDVILETQNADPDQLSTVFFVALEADTPAPFTISAGTIIPVHISAKVTTTAGKYDTALYTKLVYVDSDGSSNPVQIGSNSDSTPTLTATQTYPELHIHVPTEITVPVTKRVYLQVWADSSGSGSYAEINFYFDSVAYHIQFAISASVLENF